MLVLTWILWKWVDDERGNNSASAFSSPPCSQAGLLSSTPPPPGYYPYHCGTPHNSPHSTRHMHHLYMFAGFLMLATTTSSSPQSCRPMAWPLALSPTGSTQTAAARQLPLFLVYLHDHRFQYTQYHHLAITESPFPPSH
mmetsp:Transcript_39822/g.58604  ORF Transcript_39822/g.58604 Transcript_39822/m.58604 type:complete len:140 (+) Transcript_39822:344-763(+)